MSGFSGKCRREAAPGGHLGGGRGRKGRPRLRPPPAPPARPLASAVGGTPCREKPRCEGPAGARPRVLSRPAWTGLCRPFPVGVRRGAGGGLALSPCGAGWVQAEQGMG